MKKIYKYSFEVQDKVTIRIPRNSTILIVQTQRDTPCLWALVDPDEELCDFVFRIFGTGHPIDPDLIGDYIGTFQMDEGRLVFHIFHGKN